VIDATSAAEYYYAIDPRDGMTLEDFPSIAAPFHTCWIETDKPSRVAVEGEPQSDRHLPDEWGALFVSRQVRTGFDVRISLAVRHSVTNLLAFPFFVVTMNLDLNGKAREHIGGPLGFVMRDDVPDREVLKRQVFDATPLLTPLLFAISLMHCKNVTLREERPNAKLSNAGERRGHPPLLCYHVLEVEPMKRILKVEGGAESSGLKHALHICRGHFKDYRQSGLFGRHKGVFWWDMAARGSAEQGIVDKDYRIAGGTHGTP
jgi:hypothetical protein